ncbi:MAG: OmpA family protein [Mobilitalea sp.]
MKMKEKPKKENNERWLLTYSDLITLLMILFVLLYAISNVDQQKYEQLSDSLNQALGENSVLKGGASVLPGDGGATINIDTSTGPGSSGGEDPLQGGITTPEPTIEAGDESTQADGIPKSLVTKEDMKSFQEFIDEILDEMNMGVSVGTSMEERGLIITFKNDVFFDSGKDTLTEDMKNSLEKIARLLNKVDNSIVIEGHTDNVPIGLGSRFSSNWQLSAARAANVAQYLAEKGLVDGIRMSAVGYGEYRPVETNDTSSGRSKNRRVDIIILFDEP